MASLFVWQLIILVANYRVTGGDWKFADTVANMAAQAKTEYETALGLLELSISSAVRLTGQENLNSRQL